MFSLSPWHFLLSTLACTLLISQTYCDDRKTYIVYMGDLPPPPAAAKGARAVELLELHTNINMAHPAIAAAERMKAVELLHTNMVQRVVRSNFAPKALLHSYKKSFNGFVARLTEEEAQRMSEMEGVVSVFQSRKHHLQSTRSWDFLGFPQQVNRTRVESDIIVGVIDSGIWPESDSFKGQGFGPPPSKWKGSCQNITCNNKIIGAKYFHVGGPISPYDYASPRDSNGHGTHCASTAAGNLVGSTSLFGLALGTARGGVPSARIAVYKSCWSDDCSDADILAAFDEAISDGVDIISISLGSRRVVHTQYFEDVFAIGSFHAMKKGILTSKSADNSGPGLFTMSNYAPWFLSVAASNTDRKIITKVRLGNGGVYEGVSVNTFDLRGTMYPLIYAGDAPNSAGGFTSSDSMFCSTNSLNQALVNGKIVLCEIHNNISIDQSMLLMYGVAGLLIRTNAANDVARIYGLPAISFSQGNGTLVLSYIRSTRNPIGTILKSNEINNTLAPYVVSFSSRGPNPITPDILKPDIAAPGAEIIAAWSPVASISGVVGDNRVTYYSILSGTSMATPHVAAIAAYIKSFHPTWSPVAIKSALLTTATPMSSAMNPEAEFAYGAGQLNPIKAVNPGLVYDISESDYVSFLCGQGYSTYMLQRITNDSSICSQTMNAWDLNVPSFVLRRQTESFTRVYERSVINVGEARSRYEAKVMGASSSLSIQVTPNVLSFSSVGQKMSFRLTIVGRTTMSILSASLVWDDGTHQVRSPIVVYNI